MTPVHDHWDTEWALLSIGLRDIHASDRQRIPGRARAVHPHHHLRPLRRGQGDLAVDPGRPTPGVALGDLPHAEQRVRPGPQHHLLQGPDRGPVLLPRRREDPAPQPGYVLLVGAPVDGVPVEHVLGSVHRGGVQLAPRFASRSASVFTGSPAHVSTLSGPAARAGIRPVPRDDRLEWQPVRRESRRLSAAGIRFLGILSRRWIPPLSRSAYRAITARTPTGFPRSAHTRHDRGGRPLNPEASGVHATDVGSRSPLAASASGQALPPGCSSRLPGLTITRHHQGFTCVHPSGLPLARSFPRTERGPLGFFLELRTPSRQDLSDARRGGDRSRTLIGNYAPGMTGLQSARSLHMRDLVSHPTAGGRRRPVRRPGRRRRRAGRGSW